MNDIIALALPFFVVTMLVEWALLRRQRNLVGYEARDTAASLSLGIGYLAIAAAYKVVVVAAYVWFYERRIFNIELGALGWVAAFVVQDFCFYWFHRFGHEARIGWAGHVNHHSSTHYNLSTALRQSWTEHLFGPLFWWPLALIGVPVEALLVIEAVSLIYQYWLHTELVGKLGPFEWVFNTPSAHRVHHGRNLQYMDRNYGGILIIWDRLFGTYEPEREPVEYGITKNLDTYNPVRIAFHEWTAMIRDVAHAQSLRAALGAIFAPPGWRADGNHETVRALMQRESRNAASAAAE